MNFKCYSSEELITLNTLHEVVPTWYSFHSWVDWSDADKVSCSRRKILMLGIEPSTFVSKIDILTTTPIVHSPSLSKKWSELYATSLMKMKNWKCVIFTCYSSEKLITLNTLHEVVPTWYSFHSWVDWSNADKVSCSRRKHIDAGVRTVYLLYPRSTF